jgi:hypothetical protein
MSFNLYEAYLVGRDRREDALRDAEQRRLIKSLQQEGRSCGWLQRLGLRRPMPTRDYREAAKSRPEARRSVSSPTL